MESGRQRAERAEKFLQSGAERWVRFDKYCFCDGRLVLGIHHMWWVRRAVGARALESRQQKRGKQKVAMPSVVGIPSHIAPIEHARRADWMESAIAGLGFTAKDAEEGIGVGDQGLGTEGTGRRSTQMNADMGLGFMERGRVRMDRGIMAPPPMRQGGGPPADALYRASIIHTCRE